MSVPVKGERVQFPSLSEAPYGNPEGHNYAEKHRNNPVHRWQDDSWSSSPPSRVESSAQQEIGSLLVVPHEVVRRHLGEEPSPSCFERDDLRNWTACPKREKVVGWVQHASSVKLRVTSLNLF